MAVAQRTLAPAERRKSLLELKPNTRIALAALMSRLQALGYEHQPLVESPGQMSRRGGIVDVFPPASELPYRLELFGDEIDSMRTFDPSSQRTVSHVPILEIGHGPRSVGRARRGGVARRRAGLRGAARR